MGLTGGIASGKSAVAEQLQRLGAVVLDADRVARDVVTPGSDALAEIRARFGDEVVTAEGALDRSALAGIVFGNTAAREALDAIVHPRVRQVLEEQARAAGPDAVVVVDLPLLVETDSARDFDTVLTVDAPAETRVERLVRERGFTVKEAWERVDAQATDAERREAADAVIENVGSLGELGEATRRFWDDHVQPVLDEHAAATSGPATGSTPVSTPPVTEDRR